jgi:GH15 family glucan-1,4-alpha-glucosidase
VKTPGKKKSWLSIGLWSIIFTGLSFTFWRTIAYWQRLTRQPTITPLRLPDDIHHQLLLEAKALRIATRNLEAGIEKRRLPDGRENYVVCAGHRNFREPWARDLGFAAFGLVELGHFAVLKEALEVFLINQKPSGQFPVKVHSTNYVDRYMHSLFKKEQPIDRPIRPKYITAHNTISLDGNALLIVAILNYTSQAADQAFAKKHWPALKRAATWLEDHVLEEDGLLHQAPFADWADSVARAGRILYTNVIYWKALHDLAGAALYYGSAEDEAYFSNKAAQVKVSIHDHFWREDLGYFVTSHVFDNLSSSGNLLAIAWELVSEARAHRILDNMAAFNMADPVPTQVTHRPYPNRFIALENRLGGIGHYHTSSAWLWLGAWHVIALARVGRLEEAATLRARMAAVIVRDGAVHEVYAPNGQYLSTLWYTSEAPLTWNAGMVIHAHHVFERRLVTQLT